MAVAVEPAVVLFDGVCNLCNASIHFIIDRDPRGRFRFAALQSDAGAEILRQAGLDAADLSSLVLWEGGRAYRYSTAALRIARRLSWPWPLLAVFLLIPAFLRDPVYRFIARNRYRWFGKSETCRVPTPELRARFLDTAASREESNKRAAGVTKQ